MPTISEMTIAAKKLRTRKTPLRFRPQLVYLVETHGMYIHPKHNYLTGGQTAWLNPELHFQCHKDAKDFADTRLKHEKAKVIKLNVAAFQEEICRS